MGDMLITKGKSVCNGIAIGRILVYTGTGITVSKETIVDAVSEISRFKKAKTRAIEQLKELYNKTLISVGEEEALIFEAHRILLEDSDFDGYIVDLIEREMVSAEYSVKEACKWFSTMLFTVDDDYTRERAADIKDVSERVLAILNGSEIEPMVITEPVVIVAEDLTPSETILFDRNKILAIVTKKGAPNSHAAILARTMNIPALVAADIEIDTKYNGVMAIVDSFSERFYIEPDEETKEALFIKKAEEERRRALFLELKGKETVTKGGQRIQLYSNIGSVQDVDLALENDSEGIGLFRTEFLYLERNTAPSEEEQLEAYKTVLSKMGTKKVIIRTMDIGADKQADYLGLSLEANPALGLRGIRLCLMRQEIFKTQLRALYRASVYGKLSIMFPMITSLSEVIQIKKIIAEVKRELELEGVLYGDIELGIMIETPAAAIISDVLAPHVDFFSIGTNDLSQYTMAMDRQSQVPDDFFEPHHEAVLRMIQFTCESAHRHGKWCGICGELGADVNLIGRFLKMGIDELSVCPAYTLELRKLIREWE